LFEKKISFSFSPPVSQCKGDVDRIVATFFGDKLCYGKVISFTPTVHDVEDLESGDATLDDASNGNWLVEYGTGSQELLGAQALVEKLRYGVVLRQLEAERSAFVCPECGLGLSSVENLK